MLLSHPIRLIATDMDGTLLLDNVPYIPKENAAVLRRAADKGIALALASGRLPDDAGYFALDAQLPMHIIGLNGAASADAPLGPLTDVHHLSVDTVQTILSILAPTGVRYAVFGAQEVVASDGMTLDEAKIVIGTFLDREGGPISFRNRGEGLQHAAQNCVKIVALCQDLPYLERIRQAIADACPEVAITSSWWDNIEIIPRNANKGTALIRLANSLHIPMQEVLAIGDSDNDISMLQAAGVSVAMGNANDRVKAAARFHTLRESEFGFAAAIRALVFGEDVLGVVAAR